MTTIADDLGLASSVTEEFDRQVDNLLRLDYLGLAGLDRAGFLDTVEPLRELVPEDAAADRGRIPFVIVVTGALVATVDAVRVATVGGRHGWTDMDGELAAYRPIESLAVPSTAAYLLVDVDLGGSTLGVAPNDALSRILAVGRTPLTIEEGVAVMTQVPDVLTKRHAYQALGSRAANKRIPSFWMSKGAPRLGWCWAAQPHSWMGAASAAARLAP